MSLILFFTTHNSLYIFICMQKHSHAHLKICMSLDMIENSTWPCHQQQHHHWMGSKRFDFQWWWWLLYLSSPFEKKNIKGERRENEIKKFTDPYFFYMTLDWLHSFSLSWIWQNNYLFGREKEKEDKKEHQ